MKKYIIRDDNKPSEMFLDSFLCGHGTYEMTCEFCGTLHLCPDTTYCVDDREEFLNYCLEEYKRKPEKTVLHYDVDGVVGYDFAGKTYVSDCECKEVARYEKFIWENRDFIRRYYRIRVESELEWAKQEKTLNILAGIIDA